MKTLFSNKYLIGFLISISIIGIAYLKGYNDANRKFVAKEHKQLQKQIRNYEEVRIKTEEVQSDIQESIQLTPKNDKRDSCLLSNNPFSKDCL